MLWRVLFLKLFKLWRHCDEVAIPTRTAASPAGATLSPMTIACFIVNYSERLIESDLIITGVVVPILFEEIPTQRGLS